MAQPRARAASARHGAGLRHLRLGVGLVGRGLHDRLFLAGFLPGLLLMALFLTYVIWWSMRYLEQVPPAAPPSSRLRKLRASGNLIPCALPIGFVVWVLVASWATATECAAYGVQGALYIVLGTALDGIVCIAVITLFPRLVTWLPDAVMGAPR